MIWEKIVSALLDKNNSPAWNRFKNIMSIWNAGENVGNGAKSLYNKFQPQTTTGK